MKKPNDTINYQDGPDDFFTVCPNCKKINITSILIEKDYICDGCQFNLNRTPDQIIKAIIDDGTWQEMFIQKNIYDPVKHPNYIKKQEDLREKFQIDEAITLGIGKVNNQDLAFGMMDSRFIMGSLSKGVGDKISALFEYAIEHKLPVVLYTASGGARMQEGIVALMQMAKVSAMVKKHHEAGLFYMPVLTNPTAGGVTASFAQLGDVIIAEPGALICFAGPRVIKNTIHKDLPEGFQRAEFLLDHGFLDAIVPRNEQKEFISKMIEYNQYNWRSND